MPWCAYDIIYWTVPEKRQRYEQFHLKGISITNIQQLLQLYLIFLHWKVMILDIGAKTCPCVPPSAYRPPLASRAWRIKMIQMMTTRRAPPHPAYGSCCTLSASMTRCSSWLVEAQQQKSQQWSGSHTRHHAMTMKTAVNWVSPVSVSVCRPSQSS